MKTSAILSFLILSFFGLGQNDMVHLNRTEALQSYAPYIKIKDSLERRNTVIADSILSLNVRLEKRINSIRCSGSRTYCANLETELVDIQLAIDSLSGLLIEDIDTLAEKIVEKEVSELIDRFACQNNYLMVLDESKVLFNCPGREVTEEFVEFIQKTQSTFKK